MSDCGYKSHKKDWCVYCRKVDSLEAERDALKAELEASRKDADALAKSIKDYCENNGHQTRFAMVNGYQNTLRCFCEEALSAHEALVKSAQGELKGKE